MGLVRAGIAARAPRFERPVLLAVESDDRSDFLEIGDGFLAFEVREPPSQKALLTVEGRFRLSTENDCIPAISRRS